MASKLTAVSWKILKKIAEHLGFSYVRTKGDHMAFNKPGALRPIIIPKYPTINDPRIVKSFISTTGITQEKFLKLKDTL